MSWDTSNNLYLGFTFLFCIWKIITRTAATQIFQIACFLFSYFFSVSNLCFNKKSSMLSTLCRKTAINFCILTKGLPILVAQENCSRNIETCYFFLLLLLPLLLQEAKVRPGPCLDSTLQNNRHTKAELIALLNRADRNLKFFSLWDGRYIFFSCIKDLY